MAEDDWLELSLRLPSSPPMSPPSSSPPSAKIFQQNSTNTASIQNSSEETVEVSLEQRPSSQDTLQGSTYQHADLQPIIPSERTSTQEPEQSDEPPHPIRRRRTHGRPSDASKSEIIEPPYPWATNLRATVQSIESLMFNEIHAIRGYVECTYCEKQFEVEYDLKQKFSEVALFFVNNKEEMYHRAPKEWVNPKYPDCRQCGKENCTKPIIGKKRNVNWLFLLLGQMLGCCKLDELKYFCRHTTNHSTGAKNRLLYLTYLGLCKQVDPNGPYDIPG